MVNRRLIRPSLTEMKDQFNARLHHGVAEPAQRKKPAPPEQTFAEEFYYVKQMQARTPVAVVLTDGEVLNGIVEWYDKNCIKLTRFGNPNLLIYKDKIKYIYKSGEDAAEGGTNGQ